MEKQNICKVLGYNIKYYRYLAKYTQEQLAENTGAKVIITDVSSNDNTYGKDYSIEKYENTKWVELKN